jgi:adenylylsulfate kinase-like enzyme
MTFSLVRLADICSRTPSGTYRLRYNGDWKALNGTITTFTGVSSSFQVVNNNLRA